MAAFATYNDLQDRYDARVIGKYAVDNSTPSNVAGFSSNRRIAAALTDASAKITSACVRANKYSRAALETLAADEDKGAMLRQMTCALAMAQLLSGRVSGVDQIEEIVFGYKDALQNLDDLREGKAVFDIDANIAATLPASSAGPPIQDPNRITIRNPMFGRWEWSN